MRLIAEICSFGEQAVPWSTPYTFQGGRPGGGRWTVHQKDKRLIAWQDSIRAAHRSQHGLEPFRGAVMLSLTFHRFTGDETLWGKRWWRPKTARGHGDLTNLEKAAEDAITSYRQYKMVGKKGAKKKVLVLEVPGVIENDSQVSDKFGRKRWGPQDGIEIRVYAAEEPSDEGQDAAVV